MTDCASSLPRLKPLPPPLMANDGDTFAGDTMQRRIGDEILARTIEENREIFDDEQDSNIRNLLIELKSLSPSKNANPAIVTPILDGGPDEALWAELLKDYIGRDWLEMPWLLGEFYFYRRLMQAVRWFSDDIPLDPFASQKLLGVKDALKHLPALGQKLDGIRDIDFRPGALKHSAELNDLQSSALRALLHCSLWGNKADLSLWPVSSTQPGDKVEVKSSSSFGDDRILCDDSQLVASLLMSSAKPQYVGIITDNQGMEFFTDLILADGLIRSGLVQHVCFHVKAHPTFVSDVTLDDIWVAINCASSAPKSCSSDFQLASLGARWKRLFRVGVFSAKPNLFWNSPAPMWNMPKQIRDDLSKHNLVVVKGDANYRRLLGDLTWKNRDAFQDVVSYFPCHVGNASRIKLCL